MNQKKSLNDELFLRGLKYPATRTPQEKKVFIENHVRKLVEANKKPLECRGKGHWMYPELCHERRKNGQTIFPKEENNR